MNNQRPENWYRVDLVDVNYGWKEIHLWLMQQCGKYCYFGCEFWFENEQDALMFRLKFG